MRPIEQPSRFVKPGLFAAGDVEDGVYPKTGFLNALQHQALQNEFVSAAQASFRSSDKSDDDHPARRGGGSGARHHRSGGGPGGLIGGVVGGLFGRR
jgi:hypothetical protein